MMFDPRLSPDFLQPVGAHALTEELRAAVPHELKSAIAEVARATGTTTAAFVRAAVAEKIERAGYAGPPLDPAKR